MKIEIVTRGVYEDNYTHTDYGPVDVFAHSSQGKATLLGMLDKGCEVRVTLPGGDWANYRLVEVEDEG